MSSFKSQFDQTKLTLSSLVTDHRLTSTRAFEDISKLEQRLDAVTRDKVDAFNLQEIIHVQERSVRDIRNL